MTKELVPIKNTKSIENSNNDDKLTLNEAEEIITTIAQTKPIDKQLRFHLYRLFGMSVTTSAKSAGYKDSYGYCLSRKYRNDIKVRQRVEQLFADSPDQYALACKLQLPALAIAEAKAVQRYGADPQLLIEKPQLAKAIKQGAGVDLFEVPVVQYRTVPLQVQVNVGVMLDKDTAPEVIDVTPLGVDDE